MNTEPEPSNRIGHHSELAKGAGWDDDDEMIAADYPPDWGDPVDPVDFTGMESIALDVVLTAATPAEVGQRTILFCYLLRLPAAPQNLRELGAALGCSHVTAGARLNRLCAQLRRNLAKNGFSP